MDSAADLPRPLDKSSLSVILPVLHPDPTGFRRHDRGVAITAAAGDEDGSGDKGKLVGRKGSDSYRLTPGARIVPGAARQGRKATTPLRSVWLPKI